MKFYTYIHYTEDTNEPFYVGKGKKRRAWAFDKSQRSVWWLNTKNKHGIRVMIYEYHATEGAAFKQEKELITKFRLLGYPLCNLTDGGEGVSGRAASEKTLAALREANKGRIVSEETKRKISEASKGNTSSVGRKLSEETKQKLRVANLGKVLSDATKEKMKLRKGIKSPLFKGVVIATCIKTGETLTMQGSEDMRIKGFTPANVYKCLSNERKSAKGYTFTRTT